MSQVFGRYEHENLPKLRPASQRRTRGILAQARTWFCDGALHDPQVGSVRPDEIAAFLEAKGADSVCPRTVNLYRATLHRLFRLCVRPWLLMPSNPVAATETLREEPREPRMLTDVRDACTSHPMLQLFVTLAWKTGARSGELLQLEWGDVEMEKRHVTFANDTARGRHTKGRRSRTVPLSDLALRALRERRITSKLTASQPGQAERAGGRGERWRTGNEGVVVACGRRKELRLTCAAAAWAALSAGPNQAPAPGGEGAWPGAPFRG